MHIHSYPACTYGCVDRKVGAKLGVRKQKNHKPKFRIKDYISTRK